MSPSKYCKRKAILMHNNVSMVAEFHNEAAGIRYSINDEKHRKAFWLRVVRNWVFSVFKVNFLRGKIVELPKNDFSGYKLLLILMHISVIMEFHNEADEINRFFSSKGIELKGLILKRFFDTYTMRAFDWGLSKIWYCQFSKSNFEA